MVKRYLLTGLVAGFLSISSTLYAGESEIILKDNTTASGLTVKEETANTTIASFRGNGNVGIGTIAPTQKLEVVGNTATSGDFTFLGAGNHGLLDGAAGAYYISKNSTLLQVGAAGVFTSGIELFPGSGNSVRILNNGNVGIGTTGPGAKLQVAKGVKTANQLDITWIGTGEASNPLVLTTYAIGGADSASRGMRIFASEVGVGENFLELGEDPAVRIQPNGNVGIGTTAPLEKLHVASGSIRVDSLIRFGNGSPDNAALTIASGKIALHHFAASPTQVMTIDSSGKVGIGTTAPTERLEVLGNIKASGAVTQGSSREIKKNISYISTQEAMEALECLNPVRFEYKADASGEEHLGFIAENVPELVAEQDRKHLNSMDLTAVLTKVLQEQQKMLQTQKEAMDVMKHEIEMLKSAMNYGVKGL